MNPEELSAIQRAANWGARRASFLERDAIASELTIWVLEHPDTMHRLRERGRGLQTTLQREAARYIRAQRMVEYALHPEDEFRYTPGLLHELLPQVIDDWTADTRPPGERPSGQDPAFGGDRLAMLADVSIGLGLLSDGLRQRLVEAAMTGFDWVQIGHDWGTTSDAARLRVERGLQRLAEVMAELRVEPPFVGRREVVSNQRARIAIARGDSAPTADRSPFLEGGILS